MLFFLVFLLGQRRTTGLFLDHAGLPFCLTTFLQRENDITPTPRCVTIPLCLRRIRKPSFRTNKLKHLPHAGRSAVQIETMTSIIQTMTLAFEEKK
ncbi:hypothetical protein EUGRSUZ_E04361 [Eucalyptus grandis]|uniref:Uncharacterized protein n=2 Tax=Eucalyptus grandis TaxID=71139 RepID=A0ACC3L178_EUCGR|nr:hypothetical protein EUGRSUZ_E04361 [Eucalyptus grandis]